MPICRLQIKTIYHHLSSLSPSANGEESVEKEEGGRTPAEGGVLASIEPAFPRTPSVFSPHTLRLSAVFYIHPFRVRGGSRSDPSRRAVAYFEAQHDMATSLKLAHALNMGVALTLGVRAARQGTDQAPGLQSHSSASACLNDVTND